MNKDWRVFQLNEFDTVAAPSLEEAIKWYLKETDMPEEEVIDNPKERDIDDTVWSSSAYLTDEELMQARDYRYINEQLVTPITFRRLLEHSDSKIPFIIASIEP